MPLEYPHKSDPIGARQQRQIVNQLRDLDARLVPGAPDVLRPGAQFVAKITAVDDTDGHALYEWEAQAITYVDADEATYTDTGIVGDSSGFPLLVDVAHNLNDPPAFAVDDRVIVNVIDGMNGLQYVVDSAERGSSDTPYELDYERTGDTGEYSDTWDRANPPLALTA